MYTHVKCKQDGNSPAENYETGLCEGEGGMEQTLSKNKILFNKDLKGTIIRITSRF